LKKLLLVGMVGLFLSGCGASAKDSEFWKHPSMYKDWDHMKYSMAESCTPEMTKKSQEEGWWGIRQNECPK
jgi:hypothetical protein